MNFIKKLPLKNRLTYFFLSITLISVIAFTGFMFQSFDSGLEKSAKLRIISEYNGFAMDYRKDIQTPFKNSYVITFYFDELPDIYQDGIDIFNGFVLGEGEFEAVFVNDILPESEKHEPIYVVYKDKLHDGRLLYVIAKYDFSLVGEDDFESLGGTPVSFIFQIVFSYLILTILALWYYSALIGKKTEQLLTWSEKISNDFNEAEAPDFKFNEFNRIANCLASSLKTNAQLIEKEKRFLAHASHELRTPIAIIKANLEIFEKIDVSEATKQPLMRLERASSSMQLITETLLWLSRQSECKPTASMVDFPQLLTRLIDEQNYLIQGEEVEVITLFDKVDPCLVPLSPLMIVLNNLIRNTFQYTHTGWIKISYQDNRILIENHDTEQVIEPTIEGFGLGLELTQRICLKLDWKLDINFQDRGVLAVLYLP